MADQEITRYYIATAQGVYSYETGIRKAPREYSTCDAALTDKPSVILNRRDDVELRKIFTLINSGDPVDGVDYQTALFHLMRKHLVDTCDTEFVACGLVIAQAGENMTPCSFVSTAPLRDGPALPADVTQMTSEDEQKVLLARLLCAYRYHTVENTTDPDGTYKERVAKQMKTACAKASIILENPSMTFANRFSVAEDYLRLMCCADMFFMKFPRHALSSLKVGTLTMSFKDMAQCNNAAYIENLTGLRWPRLFCYTYESALLNEMKDIVPGDFWDCPFYFPYQSSMSLLGGKYTYYSNTKNPKFHNVVQIVGLMCSSTRAFNAYYVETPTALQVGQAIVYLMASTGEGGYEMRIFGDRDQAAIFSEGGDTVENSLERAKAFYETLGDRAEALRDAAMRSLHTARSFFSETNPRPKSFAEWLNGVDIDRLCRDFGSMFARVGGKTLPDQEEEGGDND